jgi:hypothetical protein
MRQLLPVLKMRLLGAPWPYVRKHALLILLPFLENDRGFE